MIKLKSISILLLILLLQACVAKQDDKKACDSPNADCPDGGVVQTNNDTAIKDTLVLIKSINGITPGDTIPVLYGGEDVIKKKLHIPGMADSYFHHATNGVGVVIDRTGEGMIVNAVYAIAPFKGESKEGLKLGMKRDKVESIFKAAKIALSLKLDEVLFYPDGKKQHMMQLIFDEKDLLESIKIYKD